MEQMLENKKVEEIPKDIEIEKPIPDGHVRRLLNFRDRVLICQALNASVSKEAKGNNGAMIKLARIKKVLCSDEVDDYFELIDESTSDSVQKWTRAQNIYRSYQAWKDGAMSKENLLKLFPDLNLDKAPEKPARKAPEATEEECRGKTRPFHIKSTLDYMIEIAIKKAFWPRPEDAQYVAELSEKYRIPEED